MALTSSAYQDDVYMQELVFLGYIYNNPDKFKAYANVMSSKSDMFTTMPAKEIWDKTVNYFHKFGQVPNDPEIMVQLFESKVLEPFSLALEFAADASEEDKAHFLLSRFTDTVKITILRNLLNTLDMKLNMGAVNIESAYSAVHASMYDALKLDTVDTSLGLVSDLELLQQWQQNKLPSQQPLVPVPLPGIEKYFPGVPTKEVNFVISGYGMGKSTVLAQMAQGMLQHSSGLYVTLEMPAPHILFKVLSSYSNGALNADDVFHKAEVVEQRGDYGVNSILDFLSEDKHRLFFLDMPANTIRASSIAREVKRIRMEHKVDIKWIIIDYGDLLKTESGKGISDEGFSYMISVMGEIHAIAKELDVTIWTASQTAKGIGTMVEDPKTFRPVRGKDLWGSDSKMQTGCLGFGLAVYRLPFAPKYGVGALSCIKDRYALGRGVRDLVVEINYATAMLKVIQEAPLNFSWADYIATFQAKKSLELHMSPGGFTAKTLGEKAAEVRAEAKQKMTRTTKETVDVL